MTINRIILFLAFLTCSDILFAQKIDSLQEKSNTYLVSKLDSFQFKRSDTLVWVYLNAYIQNAKRKRDYETLFYGYRSATYYSDKKQKLLYVDSALIASKKTKNLDIVGSAYLFKGGTYYEFREYKTALDNYLLANDILNNSSDQFLKNKVLYSIAVIKSYLGYYDDALSLLREAAEYFSRKDNPSYTLYYMRSLYRMGEVYQKTGKYKQAADINLLGLQESLKYNEKIQEQYFNLAIGLDDYYAKNYAIAIQNITKALPTIAENQYFDLVATGNFYIGKSYIAMRQENKALPYLHKVDSVLVKNQYLSPELREGYELLINYYKKNDNKDLQLYYINQLLKLDNVSSENNQYLAYKINKEYDTKSLLETKQKLEQRFSVWQRYSFWISSLLVIVAVVLLIRYLRLREKNKTLREKFEQVLLQQEEQSKFVQDKKIKPADIPQDVIDNILSKLEAFEEKQEFLNPRIDQKWLADKFKTNSAYISKVVNVYKESNFNGYINRLRIHYLIQLLKKEPKYRLYTVQALSKLSGYTSPRHFSDAFYAETKLRPTYFMEQLQKETEDTIISYT